MIDRRREVDSNVRADVDDGEGAIVVSISRVERPFGGSALVNYPPVTRNDLLKVALTENVRLVVLEIVSSVRQTRDSCIEGGQCVARRLPRGGDGRCFGCQHGTAAHVVQRQYT